MRLVVSNVRKLCAKVTSLFNLTARRSYLYVFQRFSKVLFFYRCHLVYVFSLSCSEGSGSWFPVTCGALLECCDASWSKYNREREKKSQTNRNLHLKDAKRRAERTESAKVLIKDTKSEKRTCAAC